MTKPTRFVIRIGHNKKDILQNPDVELLEEHVRYLRISRLSHIVHQFDAHIKAGIFNFAVVMLASPHAGVDDEFKLSAVQLQQCLEAMKIDCL